MFELKFPLMDEEGGGDGGSGGGGGGDGASWVDSLPESLRSAPFIAKSATPEAALQEIQNASAHMGNSLRLPSSEAGTEDIAAFNARLMEKVPGLMPRPNVDDADNVAAVLRSIGTPAEKDGYKFTAAEGQESPEGIDALITLAHTNGLTQAQFQGMVAGLTAAAEEQGTSYQQEVTEDMEALASEWGGALVQNQNLTIAFLEQSGAPEIIIDMVNNDELSSHEWKWLHSLATGLGNEGELQSHLNQGDRGAALTPEEANTQIQEMLNNKEHAYWDRTHPNNKAAIDKMVGLQKYANPPR